MDRLEKKKLIRANKREDLLSNRLVVVVPSDVATAAGRHTRRAVKVAVRINPLAA